MTRGRSFKRAVRARMAKTGERYTAARARLLAKWGRDPSAAPNHSTLLGLCRDTGAARNWLHRLGVREPDSDRPIGEALLTGLAGGVGFLYVVFEYEGTPPLLSILMRHDSAADRFALGAVQRLGLGHEVLETGSPKKAEAALATAVDAGTGALCVVDAGALTTGGAPNGSAGAVPTVVAVVGERNGDWIVDTGSGATEHVAREVFAEARAAFKKGKHRMLVAPRDARPVDLATACEDAIRATLERYETAPYKGFASSFGFRGMEKWARLLTDESDPKGWPRLFPEGAAASLGLRRAYQGIEHEWTPPGGGRGCYADFLREAARLCGRDAYAHAAEHFDASSARWTAVAEAIEGCGIGAVRTGCALLDDYVEMLDEQATETRRGQVAHRLAQAEDGKGPDRRRTRALYAELAERVREAAAVEREAVDALRGAAEVRS